MSPVEQSWIEKPPERRRTAPQEWNARLKRAVNVRKSLLEFSCGHVLQRRRQRLVDYERYLEKRFALHSDMLLVSIQRTRRSTSVEQQFRKLAQDWSRATAHISSASDLINDKRYQEIINLGWDVLPYLLIDLQRNKRFWFPALAAITGVRPFDHGDASNPRRMTEAWLNWGKRRGLI